MGNTSENLLIREGLATGLRGRHFQRNHAPVNELLCIRKNGSKNIYFPVYAGIKYRARL